MIDPPDRLIEDFVEGTETVEPLGSGEWGRERSGIQNVAPSGPPNVYMQYFRVLAANAKTTLFLNDRADYWTIKVSAIANNGAKVYPYQEQSGEPLLIDSGAMAIVPCVTQYLTIVANATGATVSIQVQRGHPFTAQGT